MIPATRINRTPRSDPEGRTKAMILKRILAAILTFVAKGMGPRQWWKAERARRSTRRGISVWLGLLVLLAIVVVVSQRYWERGAS